MHISHVLDLKRDITVYILLHRHQKGQYVLLSILNKFILNLVLM